MGQKRRRLQGSFMEVSRGVPEAETTLLTKVFADFEKTFIQCIVYNYEMLKEYKDEASLKAAGKVMTKGKDYGVYNSMEFWS